MYFLFKSKNKPTSEAIGIFAWFTEECGEPSPDVKPEKVIEFVKAYRHKVEMAEAIAQDPLAYWFCVQGDPKCLKVAMPIMLDGQLLQD